MTTKINERRFLVAQAEAAFANTAELADLRLTLAQSASLEPLRAEIFGVLDGVILSLVKQAASAETSMLLFQQEDFLAAQAKDAAEELAAAKAARAERKANRKPRKAKEAAPEGTVHEVPASVAEVSATDAGVQEDLASEVPAETGYSNGNEAQ